MSHAALIKRLAAIERRIAVGRQDSVDLAAFLTDDERADLADWCARYGDVCTTVSDLHRQMTVEERERWRQMLKRRLSLPS
jgi:hypothetical protein